MSARNQNKPQRHKSNFPDKNFGKKNQPPLKRSINESKENELLYYIGLGIVLILIFIIRKNYFTIPFERDEGGYSYSGKSILDGAIPYIDIGSQRLDGVFYIYAVIIAIFGYSVKALHVAFLFINLCSTTMLFFLTRKLMNNLAGFASALFFALLSMSASASGFTIQSEHIVAFFVIGAFLSLILFLESKIIWQLILAGVLFSFAFQTKQTAFFYGVLAGALLLYKNIFADKLKIKIVVRNILIFSFSVLVPIIIDLIVIYSRGAWADFELWFFDIRKQYTSLISFNDGLKYLEGSFNAIYSNYKFFWVISFIGTGIVFITSLPLWKKLTIASVNIIGFLTVVPGNHYYGHYFLQWIPAVSMNAAVFVFAIQDIIKNRLKFNVGSAIIPLIIVILPVISNLSNLSKYYFKPNHTKILRDVYGLNPFPESWAIAEKLNSIMKEEDELAVFGSEPQVYVYTNKISPTRFVASGGLLEFPTSKSIEWQNEFIDKIEKAAPKYLVFFSHPISWMANSKSTNLIFPWFDKFTTANYKLIGFADMLGNTTNYVWEPDIDLINKPPTSKYKIFIFERKKLK